MINTLKKIITNDVIYWIFLTILIIFMGFYILKKEGIKISVTFPESYNNKVVNIIGD